MKTISRYRAAIVLAIATVATLLIYQNCAMPVEGKTSPSFEAFAFESKPDTIGYMSCSDMEGADPSAFFTFRAGAYRSGGMKLAEDFYKATSGMSANKKMEFLANGDKNRDLQLQMSIRRSSDMVTFAADSRAEAGVDFAPILPPVNDSILANELVSLKSGKNLRSIPGGNAQDSRFEGTISFLESGVLEESVRTELRRGAFLAFTYHPIDKTSRTEETLAIAPGDFSEEPSASDFNKAFGFGYNINFAQGNVGSGHPARVMSSVSEVDLLTKKNTSSKWSCPAQMRFKIVRPEDVGVIIDGQRLVNCDRVIDPQVPSFQLAAVRQVLRTEDWFVDMANRCIIPKPGKVGSCYGPDLDIEYSSEGCGGSAACTHFFSVCYQPAPLN